VLRFRCPGCQSVLSGRDEQAGKIVTCPKCGQRIHAPLPARPRTAARKKSSRPLIRLAALIGVFSVLAGAAAGVWWLVRSPQRSPEPQEVVITAPPPPSMPKEAGRVGRAERAQRDPPKSDGGSRSSTHPTPPPLPVEPDGGSRSSTHPTPPPPPPSPAVEEKKEIALADDLPPELPFELVDAINARREKEGAEPIFLDAEASSKCRARAEYLARNAAKLGDKALSSDRAGEWIAAEAPLSAVATWMKEPARRTVVLEPRLRTFAAGFARNVAGQWVSVFDWNKGREREEMETKPVGGAIVYPTPGQRRVPLWFPGNEVPDPLPQTKDKLAGYPITLTFPPQAKIEDASAHLKDDDGRALDVWLSTPEKPANPQFARSQQNTICLIAKQPLRPNRRYRVEASATVNGEAWSAQWSFETESEGEIQHERAGTFLRTLNDLRRRAGLRPVPLNADSSKACLAHARYLGQNAAKNPNLNWNAEKADLPGYTVEGAALAPRASIQGGGGPVQAVVGLIDSLVSRPQLLDPRLGEIGLGYTPFQLGGWIWVIELRRVSGREVEREYFYPAPDQENVPLVYPPNEVPSPIPAENKSKLAGYAITALFDPRTPVREATAKLVDAQGTKVDGWLSSPEKPAIARFPQRCLCFLPKSPLQPGTRYTVTFEAEVNERPWRRTWSFTTLREPDRLDDDLDEKVLQRVNAVRKSAGLAPVRLDAELSRGCRAHARYLALNHRQAAVQGMGVHRQDANLPGASPQGEKAAKESVIAVLLDPHACVENWLATLYHRIPILTPNLDRVGFGLARVQGNKWACVLDTGNGRAASSNDRPRSRRMP
jgi:uncharacterized protein YkwD